MSGIVGYFGHSGEEAFQSIYYGLYALQHRGQQGVGIATIDQGKVALHKGPGLIKEQFGPGRNDHLPGSKGIGFVKYKFRYDTMPVMPMQKDDAIIAIDGIITNEDFQLDQLFQVLKGDMNDIADYLKTLTGAFTFVYLSEDKMVAFRESQGHKPLSIGFTNEATIVATESCAIDSLDARFIRDIQPGEIFQMTDQGQMSHYLANCPANLCAFEFVYIARPDSVMDNVSIYDARYRMGQILAEEAPVLDGVVIGAPDSGVIAAQGYANKLGLPYKDGFVRNPYIGRTFIQEKQVDRERGVHLKLSPIKANVTGQNIILVDDSIVRGSTIKRIVRKLKKRGANSVHVRISAPEVLSSNNITFDIPSDDDLIARDHSIEEMQEIIGCDSLAFISLDGLHRAVGHNQLYQEYFFK